MTSRTVLRTYLLFMIQRLADLSPRGLFNVGLNATRVCLLDGFIAVVC